MKYDIATKTVELDVSELCLVNFEDCNYEADICRDENGTSERTERCANGLSVSAEVKIKGQRIKLTGFAHSVLKSGKSIKVNCVKSISRNELQKKPSRNIHAYAKCCAYLACLQENLDNAEVCTLLRCDENQQSKTYVRKTSFSELDGFVKGLLSGAELHINQIVRREEYVRASALTLNFPYKEIREGQDEMMRNVATAINKKCRMFAQAPTGIGKTISALYPAVRAFGKGQCDKIFYFTAKTETAREAYSAASRLYSAGARLRTIVLSSKDNMCCSARAKINGHRDARYCNECDCIYKKNYKERAEKAIKELLEKQNGFYASVVSSVALKYGVCPYELSLDVSEFCDIIICDYNYILDPFVRLKRYFCGERRFGEYVFLFDEAHNLADRTRTIYSASISQSTVKEVYEAVRVGAVELSESFSEIIEIMRKAKALCKENRHTDSLGNKTGYYISRELPSFFSPVLNNFSVKLENWLKRNKNSEIYETVDGVYSEVRKFVGILDYYDDKFMTYIELFNTKLTLSLNCMDPSDILDDILSYGRSTVMFSATLTPLSYFCELLGGGKKSLCIDLPSPYEQENLCVVTVDGVSTRFDDREKSYKKIASCIAAAVSPKAGNYIVYFPSYDYLEKVYEVFSKKYPGVRTVVQHKGMNRTQHAEFIESFKDDENKMRIGFCVLGGSFSEGVDLPGNRLIGSIVVGVGLPGFSSYRNIMRDYFENRYENGFEYAYTYPGMNNVLQAAGRVIRHEKDKGIVVLIDDRYSTPTYRNLFPKHWSHMLCVHAASELAETVGNFWNKKQSETICKFQTENLQKHRDKIDKTGD